MDRFYCPRKESAEVGVPALAGNLAKEPPKGGTPTDDSNRGQYITRGIRWEDAYGHGRPFWEQLE